MPKVLLNRRFAVERLRNDLVDQITGGKLAVESPVMSGTELSKLYDVSYPTVHRVLSGLAEQGYLYRIQGKGTFVAPRPNSAGGVDTKWIGLFMRSEGHVFESLFRHLSQPLQADGFLCATTDITAAAFCAAPESRILDVLNANPVSLVVEGLGQFPFHILKRHERRIRHLVVIHRQQTVESLAADAILSDYERGGYLAARHLLERGHRRFAIGAYGGEESTNPEWQHSRDRLRGFRCAMREYGLGMEAGVVLDESAPDVASHFRSLFQSASRPTAALASADFRVRYMYSTLKELGLSVPGDVSLMGYFNTPWCGMLDVPLTSVSIREDEIARLTAERIELKYRNPDAPLVRTFVEPSVIARASTATASR